VAMRVRDRGGDVDEVVAALERLKGSLRLVFTLENLEFLRRGGRIGGARALLGTVLSIKPILEVVEGKIEAVDRVRTYPKALERLVEEVGRSKREWGPTTVVVGHAANPEQAQATAERVASITGEMPVIVQVGAVLGCHAGPGGFGIGFHPTSLAEL